MFYSHYEFKITGESGLRGVSLTQGFSNFMILQPPKASIFHIVDLLKLCVDTNIAKIIFDNSVTPPLRRARRDPQFDKPCINMLDKSPA
jgi:hypothetical protein